MLKNKKAALLQQGRIAGLEEAHKLFTLRADMVLDMYRQESDNPEEFGYYDMTPEQMKHVKRWESAALVVWVRLSRAYAEGVDKRKRKV